MRNFAAVALIVASTRRSRVLQTRRSHPRRRPPRRHQQQPTAEQEAGRPAGWVVVGKADSSVRSGGWLAGGWVAGWCLGGWVAGWLAGWWVNGSVAGGCVAGGRLGAGRLLSPVTAAGLLATAVLLHVHTTRYPPMCLNTYPLVVGIINSAVDAHIVSNAAIPLPTSSTYYQKCCSAHIHCS